MICSCLWPRGISPSPVFSLVLSSHSSPQQSVCIYVLAHVAGRRPGQLSLTRSLRGEGQPKVRSRTFQAVLPGRFSFPTAFLCWVPALCSFPESMILTMRIQQM